VPHRNKFKLKGKNDMKNKYLLSLCIPTYNRGKFLDISLSRIKEQFKNITDCVELIVSDNCSTDNTSEIVQKYMDEGLAIRYVKNPTNLGVDGNLVQCFRMAQGEYVWLPGDDDYLKEGALSKILEVLKSNSCGLVHLQIGSKGNNFLSEYNNPEKFFLVFGVWITFISSNIVSTKYVSKVNFEKYMGTTFTHIPLYITAVLSETKNIIIHEELLEIGADSANNGGYNAFKVFVSNYLNIWKEFVRQGKFTRLFYERQKYFVFKFLVPFIFKVLVKNDIGNYKIDNAWRILLTAYGFYPYFYWHMFFFPIKVMLKKTGKFILRNNITFI
jgi:glycosyltransferase involved in cell wall biosynthesis